MPLPLHVATSRTLQCAPPPLRMGIFDDAFAAAKEAVREVTVQHVLVASQMDAYAIYDGIVAEGASPEVVAKYAIERSTCGSASKRPDAKMQMLRGQPGELRFRRCDGAPVRGGRILGGWDACAPVRDAVRLARDVCG